MRYSRFHLQATRKHLLLLPIFVGEILDGTCPSLRSPLHYIKELLRYQKIKHLLQHAPYSSLIIYFLIVYFLRSGTINILVVWFICIVDDDQLVYLLAFFLLFNTFFLTYFKLSSTSSDSLYSWITSVTLFTPNWWLIGRGRGSFFYMSKVVSLTVLHCFFLASRMCFSVWS